MLQMGLFENFPKFCLFFEIYAKIGFYTNLKSLFFKKTEQWDINVKKRKSTQFIMLEIIVFEHNLVLTVFK